jgi:hypothetical protein
MGRHGYLILLGTRWDIAIVRIPWGNLAFVKHSLDFSITLGLICSEFLIGKYFFVISVLHIKFGHYGKATKI